MAIKPISQLPDPIQPLSNDDYLMLSVFNPDSGGQLSVKCTLGQLKDYVMGGAPQISCDGALNWFAIAEVKGVNFDNPTIPATGVRVLVNGIEYPNEDIGFFESYDLPENYPIPSGAVSGGGVRNATGDYLRLEYQLLPEDQDQYSLLFFGDNPTIIELGANHWGVCVSPSETPVISCAGATPYMDFGHLSQGWTTEVDGVLLTGEGYDDPAAMIRFYYQGIIGVNNDGFANFENLTDQPHRIKFTPIPDYNYAPFYSINLETDYPNDSFMELDDGSIIFCLARAAEECVPDSVLILPNANAREIDPSTEYTVSYELFDGVSMSSGVGTFTTESTYSSGLASYGDLLYSLAVAIGLSFHGGGGGTTAWSIGYRQMGNHGIIGGDGSGSPDGKTPQTLKLILTPTAANDAVQVLFGEGITVHSCGPQYFDGI